MKPTDSAALAELAVKAVQDLKGRDPKRLDVTELTDVMDELVIATGTSSRHVRSIAENVIAEARKAGVRPIGMEGQETGEWVLVDLGDIVVHIMQPAVRAYYNLEELWGGKPVRVKLATASIARAST